MLMLARDHNAASHPEILARQDALLLGIYRMLSQLVPSPAPPVADLTLNYLDDLANLPPRLTL